jgi:hypothetical protein
VDISCHFGIVVSGSGTTITIFSIERDERLRAFSISKTTDETASSTVSSAPRRDGLPSTTDVILGLPLSPPSRTRCTSSQPSLSLSSSDTPSISCILHVGVCNQGLVVVHSVVADDQKDTSSVLSSYSFMGHLHSECTLDTLVSFFDVPSHNDVLVVGLVDGSVILYSVYDFETVYRFSPHISSISIKASKPLHAGSGPGGGSSAGGNAGRRDSSAASLPAVTAVGSSPGSPIISVALGPDPLCPVLMTVTAQCGAVYLQPLADFVKWERNREPNIVATTIAVVKESLQSAQSLIASTGETAVSMATSARSMAIEEWKRLEKLDKTSLLKNVTSLFGLGGGAKK